MAQLSQLSNERERELVKASKARDEKEESNKKLQEAIIAEADSLEIPINNSAKFATKCFQVCFADSK